MLSAFAQLLTTAGKKLSAFSPALTAFTPMLFAFYRMLFAFVQLLFAFVQMLTAFALPLFAFGHGFSCFPQNLVCFKKGPDVFSAVFPGFGRRGAAVACEDNPFACTRTGKVIFVGGKWRRPYIYSSRMNQNPEQLARDEIDRQLLLCGWVIQNKNQINLAANLGVAIREYQTSVGPADYVLFVSGKPVGLIEAKREEGWDQLE